MSTLTQRGDHWSCAYVGVGSNLDDPPRQVSDSIDRLSESSDCRVAAVSSLWRTSPVGPQDQPDYCNAVVGLLMRLKPKELLQRLLGIERRQGRRRDGQRWGARVIDLDVLHVVGQSCQDEVLTLPHPYAVERAFVMVPWAEIAPHVVLQDGRSVQAHADALGRDEMRRWRQEEAPV